MRLLQVGMGRWGRSWASSVIPAVPEVEPVGYVDTARETLSTLVDSGLATEAMCFSSAEEAIQATSPDAVLVTANLPGHVPAARSALEADKHVLIEKPFASSVEEARNIVALAGRNGLTVMISQNYRFFPAVSTVREIVREGTLGRLDTISVDFRRAPSMRTARSGRPPLTEPLLCDMSIHHFDLMRAVTGQEAHEIVCRTWHPDGYDYGGPPAGAALITLGDGLVVSYRGSWISRGASTAWAGEWRMEFEQGELWWTSRVGGSDAAAAESVRIRSSDGAERAAPLPHMPRIDRAGSLTEFEASVRKGREPETSGRDNLGSLAMTYAAIESAQTGRPVAIG